MSGGSYETSTFSEDIKDEIKRLGTQVDLFWEEEQHIYDSLSLPANPRILEVGSGPGFYVKKLSTLFPDASFVSLEYDKTFSDYQPQLFGEELSARAECICGDINTIEGLGEFDLVVSRMVLEHLPNPERVFDKMSAFVRVGGTFVLLDNDFSNHLRTFPRVAELDELYQAYCEMRVSESGNPYIGRELPRFYAAAGYKDIAFKTITAHTYKTDKALFLGAESSQIGMTLVKKGFINEATFKKLIVNWSKMALSPDNVMMRELYCAIGKKVSVEGRAEATPSVQTQKADTSPVAKVNRSGNTEEAITAIWCELLALNTVDTDVSFFEIGGESFHLPLLVDALATRHGISIEITDIFAYPTIRSLVTFVDSSDGKPDAELEKAASSADRQRAAVSSKGSNNPFARLKKK